MPPCVAEAGFDLALAKLWLLSLPPSWFLLAFLHRLQLPVPEEEKKELQGAFLLPRC